MRIDREAFALALAALAGCERADDGSRRPPPLPVIAPAIIQRPAPIPAPTPPPPPPPAPAATIATHESQVPPPAPARTTTRRVPLSNKRWFLALTSTQRQAVSGVCASRASVQCHIALRMGMAPEVATNDPGVPPNAPVEDPDAAALATLASSDRKRVAAYCEKEFTPPSCETPLVVAFDNQPVDFAAPAARTPFAFVPGEPMTTDWPTATTPWIALDVDGDGAITSGAELFGSSTVLPGGARAPNGFAALAPLDANGDGVLDARDPMFGRLMLWTDRDGDRRSTPDELRPLASVITSISLAFTVDPRCTARGDCEGERATLHWRDAAQVDHVGTVVDVYIPRR